jgi:hypothetical protein
VFHFQLLYCLYCPKAGDEKAESGNYRATFYRADTVMLHLRRLATLLAWPVIGVAHWISDARKIVSQS